MSLQNAAMTNQTADFSTWHRELHRLAISRGGSAADSEAWRDDYEQGKTPLQAWEDEWGSDDQYHAD